MIIDFHTHTYHSYDSMMKPEKILRLAKQRGLTGIVINDHNTIKGGLECTAINKDKNFKVIVGAEIATDIGDVTGIFLKEEIQSHKYNDVITEIKKQGGITILNHPYVGHKLEGLNYDGIDLIEGFNSRVDLERNMKAVELAKKYYKPVIAGSDAHIYSEIANCRTIYNSENLLLPVQCEFRRNVFYAYLKSQAIKSFKNKDPGLLIKLMIGAPRKIVNHLSEKTNTFLYHAH